MAKLYVVIPASAVYVREQMQGGYSTYVSQSQCHAASPDALLTALARRLTQEIPPMVQTFATLDEAKEFADKFACRNAASYYILETIYKASPVYPMASNLVVVE